MTRRDEERKRYGPNCPLADVTIQYLWTALLLKRHFNWFKPQQIVQDLYAQPDLWQQFWRCTLKG